MKDKFPTRYFNLSIDSAGENDRPKFHNPGREFMASLPPFVDYEAQGLYAPGKITKVIKHDVKLIPELIGATQRLLIIAIRFNLKDRIEYFFQFFCRLFGKQTHKTTNPCYAKRINKLTGSSGCK